MDRPNILLIIWDACRYDYAAEHATYLNELASSNLLFENAVAPSPWSLPSHASIFTGKHPHEHGSYGFGDSVETPLVTELSERGYTTYGVSANGFASQRTGFHEEFDEFRYTGGRDLYLDGMDISGTAQGILRDGDGTHKDALLKILKRIPGHNHSFKSLANLFAVSCGELATKFDALQKIPHPIFAPTSDYSYKPEKNTRSIRSFLREHDSEDPFFLFTNYMDTHRCYKPPDELQEKHIGRSLSYAELVRLNEEVAAPWKYEEKKSCGELQKDDVSDIRGLYAGEVETADEHLQKVCETLESEDMLDDTLIVVTADHGENLGKIDRMGRQRMGHEASVSDSVLRVPLVVAHPELEKRTVDEFVSIKDLYSIFLNIQEIIGSEGENLSGLLHDGPTASQYPPKGGAKETAGKHPDVAREIIGHAASESSAVAYEGRWKVVAESTGERWSGYEDKETGSEAPQHLVELVEDHLLKLEERGKNDGLSNQDVEQLEALGYI